MGPTGEQGLLGGSGVKGWNVERDGKDPEGIERKEVNKRRRGGCEVW